MFYDAIVAFGSYSILRAAPWRGVLNVTVMQSICKDERGEQQQRCIYTRACNAFVLVATLYSPRVGTMQFSRQRQTQYNTVAKGGHNTIQSPRVDITPYSTAPRCDTYCYRKPNISIPLDNCIHHWPRSSAAPSPTAHKRARRLSSHYCS